MLQKNPDDGVRADVAASDAERVVGAELNDAARVTNNDRSVPWIDAFDISPEVPGHSGAIRLTQVSRSDFVVGSTLTFKAKYPTGLENKVPRETIEQIRTVTPNQVGVTDLASVPLPLRWFVESYGVHTPAALIHDRLIGAKLPKGMTEPYADRYFRYMLKAVGVSWLRRSMMWAAVALRSRMAATGASTVVRLRNWAGLGLWLVLTVFGTYAAVQAVVQGSWEWALFAALPLPAAFLWGRQWGAGLIALVTAPWLLPPTILVMIGFAVYWLLEKLLARTPLGGLRFHLADPSRMGEPARTEDVA